MAVKDGGKPNRRENLDLRGGKTEGKSNSSVGGADEKGNLEKKMTQRGSREEFRLEDWAFE